MEHPGTQARRAWWQKHRWPSSAGMILVAVLPRDCRIAEEVGHTDEQFFEEQVQFGEFC